MKEKNYNNKYTATVFCSGNTVKDKQSLKDAMIISEYLAKKGIVLANGGSKDGLMGYTAKSTFDAGGKVYGIGLASYENEPHSNLSEWEGYYSFLERQERLLEIGDFYIALNGGLGTIHEILDVHMKQFLKEIKKPMILVGKIGKLYKYICDEIKNQELYYKLPEEIYIVKDAKEAIKVINKIIEKFEKTNYVSEINYPTMSLEEIYKHIKKNKNKYSILFNRIKMNVYPDVYPSNRFRSSKILGEEIKKYVKNKTVADIACGHGTLGIVASLNGAKEVIQTEISKIAYENAIENKKLLELKNIKTFNGSLFISIPNQYKKKFDLIIFNPPFHKENIKSEMTDLQYAFSTKKFSILEEFFLNVKNYLKPSGEVLLGFSNKDKESLEVLERIIEKSDFKSQIMSHKFKGSNTDYRIYKLNF